MLFTIDESESGTPKPVLIDLAQIAAVDTRFGTVMLRGGNEIRFFKQQTMERLLVELRKPEVQDR